MLDKRIKNIYGIVLLFASFIFFSGKDIDIVVKKKDDKIKYSVSDSLENKSYDELWKLFVTHYKDSVFAKKISNTYLNRAKNDNDVIKTANGYRMFFEINADDPKIALVYVDSMIAITKGVKHEYYPARGHLLKGYLLQKTEKFDQALEAYMLSKKYAEISNNMEHLIVIRHNIAILKTAIGKDSEALETYKENYNLLVTKDIIKKFRSEYIGTLYQLSDSYNRLKKYDSAHFYLKKGIKATLSGDKPYFYTNLLSSYGINSYYRKEYTTALDSLKKSLALSDRKKPFITYLYLGKTLLKLKQEEKAIDYLKKVDSAVHVSNYSLETREAFTLLIDHFKKNDDKSNQLRIMEKLITLDSSFSIKNKRLHIDLVKKYNVKLIQDKEELINSIKNQSETTINRIWLFGGIVVLIISLGYFYYYKRRKIGYEKTYKEILLSVQKKKQKTKDIELAPELKQEILKRLDELEKNMFFLKNDLTQSNVAKKLKTNSTYLSRIINMDKQKNFANYINDLRIEYCLQQIKNDKKFRHYSITSMAKEVGFNNIQSFVKAFYKQKGCNPTEYLKSIEKH
ncbi:helix-turn-helix domain-containing protein [Aquimarina sediminis]|uniref:helix-turn-helix domain-containing protein n=1 Tax=Aquimarina sediminis TaxID=2070536 RepID=UPI000CA05E72|nr:AraC family transcriptional regulator [Aquimarina sediminis]